MVMHELRCQDRKSTRLNSNLHSFPTRRSSDLASGLRGPASWGQRVAREGKLTRAAQRRANGYARIKVPRSEEHTSELQSPLFPYTTLFRSRFGPTGPGFLGAARSPGRQAYQGSPAPG